MQIPQQQKLAPSRRRSPQSIAIFVALFVLSWGSVEKAECQSVVALYNFNSQNSSQYPQNVALAQGRDAELYGTTLGNGTPSYGSIFKISTSRIFAELFDFNLNNGCCPGQGIILATDGNLYGVVPGGGASNNGLLFKISANGAFTDLHDFTGSTDGEGPFAPPIEASDGNLYGVTLNNSGTGSTVYQYTPSGNLTTIYQFIDAYSGAPLMQAADGFLYGTTGNGGWAHCGTIFKMSTAGVFMRSAPFLCGAGGAAPSNASLLQASDGNFYGVTEAGGIRNGGTIFKMTPGFKLSTLYTFMGKSVGTKDGFTPVAGLIQATDGDLYGATAAGGANGMGTLYRISTSGEYQLLYNFNGAAGKAPQGTLMQHTNGILYGTAQLGGANRLGTVYGLNLGLGPFITFVRSSGAVGQTAQILGQQLSGAASVTFNGVPATFTAISPTYLVATIPAGATSGPVVVTSPTATLTSNVNFNVEQ